MIVANTAYTMYSCSQENSDGETLLFVWPVEARSAVVSVPPV
jgi:hypothetical protein